MDQKKLLHRIDKQHLESDLIAGLQKRSDILWLNLPLPFELIIRIWRQDILALQNRFLVYGAGTLAGKIFEVLAPEEYQGYLAGFVDRRFGSGATFPAVPAPIYPLEQLKKGDFAHLVLCHPQDEILMKKSAMALGVPEEKILCIYSGHTAHSYLSSVANDLLARETAHYELISSPA